MLDMPITPCLLLTKIEHVCALNGKNAMFHYTCLPNGISCAPRYLTKLLKPVYSTLRKMGHLNLGYIDDSLLIGDSSKECLEIVNDTNWLFEKVGVI